MSKRLKTLHYYKRYELLGNKSTINNLLSLLVLNLALGQEKY